MKKTKYKISTGQNFLKNSTGWGKSSFVVYSYYYLEVSCTNGLIRTITADINIRHKTSFIAEGYRQCYHTFIFAIILILIIVFIFIVPILCFNFLFIIAKAENNCDDNCFEFTKKKNIV